MKYLKKYENFDPEALGRFQIEDESDEQDLIEDVEDVEDCEDCEEAQEEGEDDDVEEGEEEQRRRVWGDEVVEKKKINPGFQAYLDKKKGKKVDPKDKKADKEEPKGKKADKEEEKPAGKGLTAKQKKLPAGLQKAILARKK